MNSTLVLLALPLALIALVIGATQRQRLVFALPFLAPLHRLPIEIGSHSIRLDALAAVILTVGLVPSVIGGGRRLIIDTPAKWLGLVFVLNIVASAIYSPAKQFSFVSLASLMSVWAVYVVLINCLTTFAELDRFLNAILIAGLLEALVGIVAFMLAAVGIDVGGATYISATDLAHAFGAYGTMWEPNIYGGFCACYLVLTATLLWMAPHAMSPQRRQLVLVTALATSVGLLLSFTRGAWLSTFIALMAIGVVALKRTGRKLPIGRVITVVAVLGGMFIVALMTPGETGDFLRYKLANLANPQSESGTNRIIVSGLAMTQWLKHPWLGLGTYSFAAAAFGKEFVKYKDVRALWIPNWAILTLHDTGPLGLIAFTGILVSVMWAARRASLRLWKASRFKSATAIGLAGVVFVTTLASMFSTSFSLGYPWMFMGLASAYDHVSKRFVRPRSARSTRPPPAVDAAGALAGAPR